MADITKPIESTEPQQSRIIVKTEIDAYIDDQIKSGPQSAQDVVIKDFTPENARHRMALPKEIERKYGRKYAFRWVAKDKRMIDRAVYVRKWLIVNRTLFSDMPRHFFTANGTIENGDTILCFMPIESAEKLRKAPGDLSSERVKNIPMDKWRGQEGDKSPYYKPALGTMERDGEISTTGIQPDVQTT